MLRACTPSPQKALSIIWSMFDLTRLFADLESQKRLLGQPFTELKRSLLIEHFAVTANDLKRYSRSRFSPASCGCGLPQKREQNFVRFKNTEKKPQAFGLVAFLSRDIGYRAMQALVALYLYGEFFTYAAVSKTSLFS